MICKTCAHEEDVHDIVCRNKECFDDTPMCLDCISELNGKFEIAFHRFNEEPIEDK